MGISHLQLGGDEERLRRVLLAIVLDDLVKNGLPIEETRASASKEENVAPRGNEGIEQECGAEEK